MTPCVYLPDLQPRSRSEPPQRTSSPPRQSPPLKCRSGREHAARTRKQRLGNENPQTSPNRTTRAHTPAEAQQPTLLTCSSKRINRSEPANLATSGAGSPGGNPPSRPGEGGGASTHGTQSRIRGKPPERKLAGGKVGALGWAEE